MLANRCLLYPNYSLVPVAHLWLSIYMHLQMHVHVDLQQLLFLISMLAKLRLSFAEFKEKRKQATDLLKCPLSIEDPFFFFSNVAQSALMSCKMTHPSSFSVLLIGVSDT